MRARSVGVRVAITEVNEGRLLYPEVDPATGEKVVVERPRTRGECENGERPCPFAGCRYHLFVDVNPKGGSLKLNFPDMELWELSETCALDVADRGGIQLEKLGYVMNLTRERIRQIEMRAVQKLARDGVLRGFK